MDQYGRGDAALELTGDTLVPGGAPASGRPDEETVLLDVAANFATEHGVPGADLSSDGREQSLRRAARQWPLLVLLW